MEKLLNCLTQQPWCTSYLFDLASNVCTARIVDQCAGLTTGIAVRRFVCWRSRTSVAFLQTSPLLLRFICFSRQASITKSTGSFCFSSDWRETIEPGRNDHFELANVFFNIWRWTSRRDGLPTILGECRYIHSSKISVTVCHSRYVRSGAVKCRYYQTMVGVADWYRGW